MNGLGKRAGLLAMVAVLATALIGTAYTPLVRGPVHR